MRRLVADDLEEAREVGVLGVGKHKPSPGRGDRIEHLDPLAEKMTALDQLGDLLAPRDDVGVSCEQQPAARSRLGHLLGELTDVGLGDFFVLGLAKRDDDA